MDLTNDNEQYQPLGHEASFKIDEGFVDDTPSLDDGDSAMELEPGTSDSSRVAHDPLVTLHNAVMSLNESQRCALAYQVLQTLKTSSIAAIVEMLTPRLHIDPVLSLPPELTSIIFAYLAPESLLEASRVSKAWRERTLDSSLWKQKFIAEGWKLDTAEVFRFEQDLTTRKSSKGGKVRKSDAMDLEHLSKKRHTLRHEEMVESSSIQSHEEDIIGVERLTMEPSIIPSPSAISSLQLETLPIQTRTSYSLESDRIPDAMIVSAARSDVRLNYHHVYRQRRRLEDNWSAGRFKSFQLPHKDHPEEAHNECVYTIQYAGRYLVSGSRDRTLRIWDLDTQRLIRRPLAGHTGSVLCLQFDASPEEDTIVSGSSDTDVIIWQFSTGRLLRRISQAHTESVLNIKFDKRYLVTCSKDKLIKIWNRKLLHPGDDAYPIRGVKGGAKFPPYVLDLSALQDPRDMEQHFTPKQLIPLTEYSLIMIIDLHAAAVNAVHIYKDELVSASGDRDIKVFNIRTGAQTALCKGHNKGIACVQYDGIRIVSGSSDDTIRIFDPKSQAEVGCLQGHSKLVRTVQASFGDHPGNEEELEKQARKVDQAVFAARAKGQLNYNNEDRDRDRRRRRERNAGSSKPQDVMAIGAHLPPGGGGSPWARIISGSYDETVIIWRKAKDGRWVPHHTLKQADALKAAGKPLLTRTERLDLAARGAAQQIARQQQAGQMVAQNPAGSINTVNASGTGVPGPSVQQTVVPPQWQMQAPPTQRPAPIVVPQPPMNMHHHHDLRLHPGQNARVFKLQFDARRIVACSQDPKIVGWDFADGDEDIIHCSRFFAQPN